MQIDAFLSALGADYFTGVPDSLLKPLCNTLYARYGTDPAHHVIAANEGNACAIAAGYHLATGKTAVVYMQNSGEGNAVNPLASLLDPAVYGIPVLFVIGWRGEPGVHDEPQHVKQGQITTELMELLGVEVFVLHADTGIDTLQAVLADWRARLFPAGRSAAIVVRKGALTHAPALQFTNRYTTTRERAIEIIAAAAGSEPIVCTTGKASRELFEIRARHGQSHRSDFLTVGSMGHGSSIALGLAMQTRSRVWCIDGDGAALMHLGALSVIGKANPANLVHVVINNEAHETVGGLPTAADHLCLAQVAAACGYPQVETVADEESLTAALASAQEEGGLRLIEVRCAIGARADLGRPTTTARENKEAFMAHLQSARPSAQESFEALKTLFPQIDLTGAAVPANLPSLLRMARLLIALSGDRTLMLTRNGEDISAPFGVKGTGDALYFTDDRYGIAPGASLTAMDGLEPAAYLRKYLPAAVPARPDRVIWSEAAASAQQLRVLTDGEETEVGKIVPGSVLNVPQICAEDLETALIYAGDPQGDELAVLLQSKSESIARFSRLVIDLRRTWAASEGALSPLLPLLRSHACCLLINEDTMAEGERFARSVAEAKAAPLIGRATAGVGCGKPEVVLALPDGYALSRRPSAEPVMPGYSLPFTTGEILGPLVVTSSRCTCH